MVLSELDSFLFQFKHILHAEKNATLTFNAEAGRAQVTLCAGTSRSHQRKIRAEKVANITI